MDIIDVFINRKGKFLENLDSYDVFTKFFNPIFLTNAECFEKAYDIFLKYHRFRLWIHLEWDNNDYPQGLGIFQSIKNQHENIDIQFITRNNSVKIYEGHNVYYALGKQQYWEENLSTISVNEPIDKIEDKCSMQIQQNNETIQKSLQFIDISQDDKNRQTQKIDIVIITALYFDEMEKIKEVFSIKNENNIAIGKNNGYKFTFKNKNIIAVSQVEMGMVDAAILTTKIINDYMPEYVIMPGVCGGDKKTSFGSIVISKKIELLFAGKLTDDGEEKDNIQEEIDIKSIENIKTKTKYKENGIYKGIIPDIENILRITELYKEKYKKFLSKDLNFYIEPTACSSLVINKKGYFEDYIKKIDRKMIAVEMEGYGLARAVKLSDTNTKAILVKCVMDKTEDKDSDIENITPEERKDYAALVSALFVKQLIEKDLLA